MRGRFLVMVLWNITKAIGAARHSVTRPRRRSERRIEKYDSQQAHKSRENSAAILGEAVHKLDL
jgi:hypothetical protein